MVHVDAGHTASECGADLRLAAQVLAADGAIILDDAFRADWPGVTEALLAFLRDPSHDLVPIVAGANKLVLVRRGVHAEWQPQIERLAARYFPWPSATTRVCLLGSPYIALSSGIDNDDGVSLRAVLRSLRALWHLRRAAQH